MTSWRKHKYKYLPMALIAFLSIVARLDATEHLPKVLIIGDSIAGGYFSFVEEGLVGEALLFKPIVIDEKGDSTSCEGTTMGVENIEQWIGEAKWDVIHFNFGLHDIKHIDPETGRNSKNLDHPRQASPNQYGQNLKKIVRKLKASGANLIFATTTPYPDELGRQMRSPGMPKVYNEVALKIMKKNDIAINDLYTYVLPRMDELQRRKNVHFTEEGSRALGKMVAKSILDNLEPKETMKVVE
ncbi:MAG: SGNH/GDSL hydrolase family protein [Cyclobacteriaceae bacterium]